MATGIFYTGYRLLPGIGISARRKLAWALGSACYLLRPQDGPATGSGNLRPRG